MGNTNYAQIKATYNRGVRGINRVFTANDTFLAQGHDHVTTNPEHPDRPVWYKDDTDCFVPYEGPLPPEGETHGLWVQNDDGTFVHYPGLFDPAI